MTLEIKRISNIIVIMCELSALDDLVYVETKEQCETKNIDDSKPPNNLQVTFRKIFES